MAALTIAVLGSGTVGRTLATGWAARGHRIVFGSRDPAGPRTAEAISQVIGDSAATVSAAGHADAARPADVVVIAVPGAEVLTLLETMDGSLAGKLVIDTTNNVVRGAATMSSIGPLRDAGAIAYRAFNTVGWEQMADPTFGSLRADLPYAGAGGDRAVVEALIADIGFRPIYFGDDQPAVDALDALARIWFRLAFNQGFGRRLGFRFLTADDDEDEDEDDTPTG